MALAKSLVLALLAAAAVAGGHAQVQVITVGADGGVQVGAAAPLAGTPMPQPDFSEAVPVVSVPVVEQPTCTPVLEVRPRAKTRALGFRARAPASGLRAFRLALRDPGTTRRATRATRQRRLSLRPLVCSAAARDALRLDLDVLAHAAPLTLLRRSSGVVAPEPVDAGVHGAKDRPA
jgi:hypothetical protein